MTISKVALDRAMDIFGSAEWSLGSSEAMLRVLQDYELMEVRPLKAANAELVKIFNDIRATTIRLTGEMPDADSGVKRSLREEFERLAYHVQKHEVKS